MKQFAKLAFVMFFLVLVGAPETKAWGCKGHQTVAYLAEKHLSPDALKMVESFLGGNPIDPSLKRFCDNTGLDDMSSSSTWADDYRDKDKTTAPWHFIDIPLSATQQSQVEQYCGAGGCVTQAITKQLAVLKDKTQSAATRAMALRFIIHFVGDLHQPLHASTNNDRGGNCVPVKYFHQNPHGHNGSYAPNLHHVWDTELVENDMTDPDPKAFADTLDAEYSSSIAEWQQGGLQLDAWAWDGHQHAVDISYGSLSSRILAEPFDLNANSCADDNNIGDRMLHKHIVIGSLYQEKAVPVIEERLAQAGIRLAMILNDAARTKP
jgi:hypothetical protein